MGERETCGTCRYWLTYEAATSDMRTGEGVCRRFPPALHPQTHGQLSSFPATDRDDWCGEYINKDAPPCAH